MTNPLLGAGYEVHPDTGEWINSEFRRIAEVINDYDPSLFLVWIKPTDRETGEDFDHPYGVMQELQDGRQVMIMVLREDELDERIIARIFAGDTKRHDVFANMDKMEAARKAMELKRKMDQIEEMKDFARTVIKSNKHSFRHNGRQFG